MTADGLLERYARRGVTMAALLDLLLALEDEDSGTIEVRFSRSRGRVVDIHMAHERKVPLGRRGQESRTRPE